MRWAAVFLGGELIGICSHHNTLDFVLGEPFLGAVIELGGARTFVRCHGLRMLQRAVVGEIGRDAGRPKTVVADRRQDAGGERALAYHAPGVDLGHRLIGKRSSAVSAAGAEQKPLPIFRDAGRGDVGVKFASKSISLRQPTGLLKWSTERAGPRSGRASFLPIRPRSMRR
jgi:hypothetical protein